MIGHATEMINVSVNYDVRPFLSDQLRRHGGERFGGDFDESAYGRWSARQN